MFYTVMRMRFSLLLPSIMGVASFANAADIVAPVTVLVAPDSRPCTFIQVQGQPSWFSLPISQQGYKEALMLLTLSYATSANVWISTNPGDQACGYPRLVSTALLK